MNEIIKIIDAEFDRLQLLYTKYEGTKNGYKYAHKMMAVRDLRNKIRQELKLKDLQHTLANNTENWIRTLSQYQIQELKTLFVTSNIEHIGREDKTGDLIVEYMQYFKLVAKMDCKRIPFNPPNIKKSNIN